MTPADVSAVLQKVVDPELGIDVVALGLLYAIDVSGLDLNVKMATTTPSCPMSAAIVESVERVLARHYPGAAVQVIVVDNPPWDPGMLTLEAREWLGMP